MYSSTYLLSPNILILKSVMYVLLFHFFLLLSTTDGVQPPLMVRYYFSLLAITNKIAVGILSQIFGRMHAFPFRGYTSKSGVGEYTAVLGLVFKDTILF